MTRKNKIISSLTFASFFLLSSLLAGLVRSGELQTVGSQCSEIGYMPQLQFVTFAKDTSEDLVDIHTFNKYFTFQIDRPLKQREREIETVFYTPKSAGKGFIFRLKAELSSSFSDEVQQGMRVTLLDKELGSILIDGSSVDGNEGSIKLDYEQLEEDTAYVLKYEFFDRQIIRSRDLPEVSFSASNTECRMPFITQELLILDQVLVQRRVARHMNEVGAGVDSHRLDVKDFKCSLNRLNNSIDSQYGEDGLYCERREYYYSAGGNQRSGDLLKIYEQDFSIRGEYNEIITYWIDITLGYNFMVGAGIKILLSRQEEDSARKVYDPELSENALSCLYDKSCIVSHMSNKNEMRIEVILTSGKYKLTIFDSQEMEMRDFMREEMGVTQIPFTFKVTSYPVIQNEDRDNCPYMFIQNDYIQNKFIEGRSGQRFSFNDKIIMNIFNLSQMIDIKPEADSLMKVRVKETFGVNTELIIYEKGKEILRSTKVGSTSALLAKLKKGVSYTLELSYKNSIIEFSDFFSCPHLNLELSLIPEKQAASLTKSQECSKSDDWTTQEKLASIFNSLIDNTEGYEFIDQNTVFRSNVNQSNNEDKTQNYHVDSYMFTVKTKMQMFIEIFYDDYLYDMELFLYSTEQNLVREHLYVDVPSVDWTKYKGAKSLFVELEPGNYEISILQKLPDSPDSINSIYFPSCVAFQLDVRFNKAISKQQTTVPPSFNYFGLLNPSGSNYGQMVYFCEDCVMENQQEYNVFFKVAEGKSAFGALIQSQDNAVGIVLIEIDEEGSSKKNQTEHRVGLKTRKTLGNDGQEEVIQDTDISASKSYKLVIVNKEYSKYQSASFTLRIEITEKSYKPDLKRYQELLPKSINDVLRYKMKAEGLKESEFLIGSRYMLQFMNEYALLPFLPKSTEVYQSKYKASASSSHKTFSLALPFTISEEEAEIYASVYDLTGVAGLGLSIYKEASGDTDPSDQGLIVNSVPSKYHSYIAPISLTKGSYVFVIAPEQSFADAKDDNVIRFSLDFVYVRENITDGVDEAILETMEVCSLPEFPENLNSPQFIHALNGYGMEIFSEYKISELVMGSTLRFSLSQSSLVIFYMEIPKEIQGVVELMKTKGTFRVKAMTDDLNSQNDNFLRQKDLTHQNIIEFREYLNAGSYDIQLHSVEAIGTIFFAMPRCQSFKVGMSVIPTFKSQHKIAEKCYETTSLEANLKFDKRVQGNLTYDIGEQIFDTSYISTSDQGEGPFIFYFHINYDSQLEGPLALVLSKYNAEELTFTEIALYEVQNSYSQLLSIIEEGTYVVSIQSLSSMAKKYGVKGLGKSANVTDKNILRTPCLKISYTYYIASLNTNDHPMMQYDLVDVLAALFSGNMDYFSYDDDDNSEQKIYDYQVMQEITDVDQMVCKFDRIPKQFPVSETGFDITYTFPIGQKNYDIIDLVSETNQLLKVYIKARDQKSNVNAFLYDGPDYNNLLVSSENAKSHKEFMINLKPQQNTFKLKLVYDTIDEQSACPVYDLRIALKPVANLVDEELKCFGLPTPPEEIKISKTSFDLEEEYAISSTFIEKFQEQKEISYDIEINATPRQDKNYEYHFDIETRFFFLTSGINLELFAKDNTGNFVSLAQSKWFNEDEIDFSDQKIDILSQKDFVNRLKVTSRNDDLSEGQTLTTQYVLRLRFSKYMQKLTTSLTNKQLVSKDSPICFPFDLSIRITEPTNTHNNVKREVELVRVEWPYRLNKEIFDIRKKLTGFLEFDEPILDIYKKMKFQSVVYLLDEKLSSNDYTHRLYPSSLRLSVVDKTSLIITFKHNALSKGTCYNLKFEKGSDYAINSDSISNQTKICTSNCLCNEKGTKDCKETKGVCVCHYPFTGKDCSECEKGHVFDPLSQDCVVQRKCVQSGGSENCSMHGVCSEDPKTGQAKCTCDLGFSHDGYSLCSKCSDPLFDYPDCVVRNWVLEDSDINCKNLPAFMPEDLYNSSKNMHNELSVYQNEEGLLNWAGRYKLLAHGSQKSTSSHNFIVPQDSVFRLFLDTLKSGAKFSYQVLDASKRIIYKSSTKGKAYSKFDQSMLLLQKPQHHDPENYPFTLEIEYEYEKSVKDHNWCPMVEVFMVVQPFHKIQNYLRCSKQEIVTAQAVKQFSWKFGSESDFFSEKFTLTSDMMKDDISNKLYISDDSENFIMMAYTLKIEQSGNALSIITSYNFESVMLSLTLIHAYSGNIIAIEKVSSLEDIQTSGEDISLDNDMASYIEVPSLEKGTYDLQILIRKSLFLPTSSFLTCLSFDLTLEYVARTKSNSVVTAKTTDDNGEEIDEQEEQYEIISVIPPIMKNLKQSLNKKIDVQLSRSVDLDIMINGENDLHHICYLKNENEAESKLLYPYQLMVTNKDTLTLYFNFEKAPLLEKDNCYKLICTTQLSVGYELFKPNQINTQYCFVPKKTFNDESEVKCNPNSYSKIIDGKCMCSYPYKGELCEQCEKSYLKKTYNGHTECILDESQCSEEICNGHGQCLTSPKKAQKNDIICKCTDLFDGKYCERCKNSTLQYPDCLFAVGQDLYDEALEKEYLHRRQYNKDGYDKTKKTKKVEQCPFNTYPTQLDAVEYMEFLGGSFHIADYYTVNHDKDNIIEMTPMKQGVIKIFIQEPEDIEMVVNDESFDLEMAIVDKKTKKFLATSTNHHVYFGDDIDGKMEYGYLVYEVPKEYLNHTLQIMFRAVNFSVSANEELSNCEMLYIEIEYAETLRECKYNEMPPMTNDIIKVSPQKPFVMNNNSAFYSVKGEKKQFIYYQDFYMGEGEEAMTMESENNDYEITISVQQKFMETNFVDFAIEIIESDIDFNDIQAYKSKYQKPYCRGVCLISGQKAYNEIHNIIQMDTRTYFRLWLYQSELDGSCANFQLFIEANKMNNQLSKADNSRFRCEELDLPRNLNSERYLGEINPKIDQSEVKQQDFHVLERFRVDNLRNSSIGHVVWFKLFEPTVVRFSAPVHKHIEFDMELQEAYLNDNGKTKTRKLIFSTAKDFEDTIFAQLDKGHYFIKLIFASPEFYLSQPCQSIQLEIAMKTIQHTNDNLIQSKDFGKGSADFSFENVLGNDDRSMKIQKRGVIKTNSISKYSTESASYAKLFEDRFTLPDKEGMGIMIYTQSNFLLNDINFALTHIETGTIYHNLKRESMNKLILENMAAGTFELLIYAHNCLTNLDFDYIQSIDVSYSIDLNMI